MIQDREEPVSTPGYAYTFLLTYGGVYDASRRAPAEIRFLVYPSWCNSPEQWTHFFETQGWQSGKDVAPEDSDVSWMTFARNDGGRNTRMYVANHDMFQYVFLVSQDAMNTMVSEPDATGILKSFRFTKGAPNASP